MKNNDDCTDQANGTTQFAQCSEFFLQEIRSQNGTNQDTERTERSDENGRRERICGKVAHFSNADWEELATQSSLGYSVKTHELQFQPTIAGSSDTRNHRPRIHVFLLLVSSPARC